jgi:hypothetical protein
MPMTCGWEWDDDAGRSWSCDGGYYYNALVSAAHWENQWRQGRYVYERVRDCDDDGNNCFSRMDNVWHEGPFTETVDNSRYVTTTIHHDALTHNETVTVPAATHAEKLSYDAIVGDSGGANSGDDAAGEWALLLGLTALAGAGRFVKQSDAAAVAAAEWSQSGRPLPSEAVAELGSSGDTVVDEAATLSGVAGSTPSGSDGGTPASDASIANAGGTSDGASPLATGPDSGSESDAVATPGDGGGNDDPGRKKGPEGVPGLDSLAGGLLDAEKHWNDGVREAARAMRAGRDIAGDAASQGARLLNDIKGLRANAVADVALDVVKSPVMRGAIRAAPVLGALVTTAEELLSISTPTPGNVARAVGRAVVKSAITLGLGALGVAVAAPLAALFAIPTGGASLLFGAAVVGLFTVAGDAVGNAVVQNIQALQDDPNDGQTPAPDVDVSGWASDPAWSAGGSLDESTRAANRTATIEPDPLVGDTSGWASDPLWSAGGFLDESSRASRQTHDVIGSDGVPVGAPDDGSGNQQDDAGNTRVADDSGGSSAADFTDVGDWFAGTSTDSATTDDASADAPELAA